MKIKDMKVSVEMQVRDEILNSKLLEKSKLAFNMCKCFTWQMELEKDWIITNWHETNEKGTSYNMRPAESQEEFDENAYKFLAFDKEVFTHSEIELKNAEKIIKLHIDELKRMHKEKQNGN